MRVVLVSRWLLAGMLGATLTACSDDSPSNPSATGGGAGGSTTTTTTSATGDGGAGGTGGAGGAGGGCVSAPGAPCCEPNTANWSGSVDGQVIEESYQITHISMWSYFSNGVGTLGLVHLLGEVPLGPETTDISVAAAGVFRFPDERALAGEWYCAGEGTTVTRLDADAPEPARYTLASLSRLGSCPGTPVTGSLNVCVALGGCPGGESGSFTGTIDGMTIDWSDATIGFNSSDSSWSPSLNNGAEVAVLRSGSTVSDGYLVLPLDAPGGGGVYCIGAGTVTSTQTSSMATLTDLSRVGACSDAQPVEGTIDACAQL